jgi:hypothetical protein
MTDEEILKLARDRFALAALAEREIRSEGKKDLQYLAGEQWDPMEKKDREDNGRPALTINKLPQFIDQVVNEQRRNRPGAQVSAIGGGADPDTADVCEGLIRHIEHASHADVAYDTAFEYSASCSFGYWRYLTEYVDDESFDQEIKISTIMDPFAVYLDAGAVEPDKSDMRYAFVLETLTREEFKRRYPKSDTTGADFWDLGGNVAADWIRQDGVRVCEYWTITSKKRMLRLYSDGITRYDDDPEAEPIGEDVTVEQERVCEHRTVNQYIINGAEILERSEWPGKYIPIVPVYGKQLIVDGKRKLFSLIRFARDPQALYNYYKTAQAEAVGLSPKAPFIGYLGQFKTKAAQWENSNRIPYPFLEVDPVTVGGQPAPLPQRNAYEPPIQALSMGALQASDDIKATTGLFDPSLGAAKASMSGRAIDSQKAEGDNSNFHLVDNLTRSLWHGYRILMDLLPKVYDAERAVRIVKPDHESEIVLINQLFTHGKTGQLAKHDLALGRYDVSVSVGPGYETRREEARDRLVDLAKADPASVPQWADLYIKELDLGPIGDQIAERLTPAQFRDKADPQAMQATLQQMTQSHDQMVQQLHQLAQIIEQKKIEAESREKIAAMQVWGQVRIAGIKAGNEIAIADSDREADRLESVFDRAHEAALATMDAGAGAAGQQAAQEHAAALQQGDQEHAQQMQQDAQAAAAQQQEQQQLPKAA